MKICRKLLFATTALLGLSVVAVQACSPGFIPDVFIRQYRPDLPKQFYAGQLGVLEPTYYRFNLVAAYRYLNGGKLGEREIIPDHHWSYNSDGDIDEQTYDDKDSAQELDIYDDQKVTQPWTEARKLVTPDPVEIRIWRSTSKGENTLDNFLNCGPDAFRAAAETLHSRIKSWGQTSPALIDWIHNQDLVFRNCGDTASAIIPSPAPAQSPVLLQQDRAYQIAAANFYALRFEEARRGFDAISREATSPWHSWGKYLAARALVRQSFLTMPPEPGDDSNASATYDEKVISEAQQRLENLLKDPSAPQSAVRNELNYILSHRDPEARLRGAGLALAGPHPDSNFSHDLFDFILLLDQRLDGNSNFRGPVDGCLQAEPGDKQCQESLKSTEEAYQSSSDLIATSPLADWILTYQSPAQAAREHAIAQWKQTHSLPWLVAAISKALPGSPEISALLTAASQIPQNAPAWATIAWHRARLLASIRPDEARVFLDNSIPIIRTNGPASALNTFLRLRMSVANSLADLLNFAPRKDLSYAGAAYPLLVKDCKACDQTIAELQLDEDAAQFFNAQAPLEIWLKSVQSEKLPGHLRQALAVTGWVRAIALEAEPQARLFAAQLPEPLHRPQAAATGFAAWLTILRNPGLRFYLNPGVQRSQSAPVLDEYRENWWCSGGSPWRSSHGSIAQFLSAEQRNQGVQESNQLAQTPCASIWLGRHVIAYVKAHPEDRDSAEALALTVRATRYGCFRGDVEGKENSAVSKEAFTLLHRNYPNNPWTRKTPYYF